MRPTAVVLWLMILLVFVPIAAAHAVALFMERGERAEIAAVQPSSGAPHTLTP
jgi:hypothetical protein